MDPRLIASSVACPDCDLLQRIPPLPPGGKARCLRCGAQLAKQPAVPSDLPLALTVAAAILFLVANTSPLMNLSVVGRTASTTIAGGAYQMWLQGEEITGVLVAFCAVIAPGGYLLFMLTLLLAARRSPAPYWVGEMLRWVSHFQIWSMLEVMLLGILVALIKIAELATVDAGIGMFAVGALVLLIPAIAVNFNEREVWQRVQWVDGETPPLAAAELAVRADAKMTTAVTAARSGLVSCESCQLLSRPASATEPGFCRRCGEQLEWRRHASIETTWALVIAAAICYIPANALPVLNTTTLGTSEGDTILGGVAFLYTSGSWPLALVVLIASVMIPLGKLVALVYLMITVQRGSVKSNHERTRLYRMVEFIGRWSMLDVFVDTFTVALVQLQPLMSVAPGAGVLFFAAVVVLTMLAAESFDPRLLWDSANPYPTRHG